MSDSSQAHLEQLRQELQQIEAAMPPNEACERLKNYMDEHAKDDLLSGTSDQQSPFAGSMKNPGCKCSIM